MSELNTYPVISPIRHNGKRYDPNDDHANMIELTEKEFATLQAYGCVGEGDAKTATQDEKPQLSDEQEAKLIEAFEGLDAEKDFTKAGTPKVAAVNVLVDFDVTGEDIATVWEKLHPAADQDQQ